MIIAFLFLLCLGVGIISKHLEEQNQLLKEQNQSLKKQNEILNKRNKILRKSNIKSKK